MAIPIQDLLLERIEASDFPSAVYLAADRGRIALHGAVGLAVEEPGTITAAPETIYDLASLTKPLVTGLLTAILIEKGTIALDQRVATILNEFDVDGKRTITIQDLLTHTSHLPAWRPFYLTVDDPGQVLAAIAAADLDVDSDVIYSDLNFITLAIINERFGGSTLDRLASRQIFEPLGLANTFFAPPGEIRNRIAASENGNMYERGMCEQLGYEFPDGENAARRDGVIWGAVHDTNAYFMNGVAGHAGLFSTAEDTFRIAQQFLPAHTELLGPQSCELFRSNFTAGKNEDRSFAFQLASTAGSAAGEKMPPQSFGHTGFSGTSLWIDPVQDRVFILLTNRTHNRSLPFANINPVRRIFHDRAIELLDGDL